MNNKRHEQLEEDGGGSVRQLGGDKRVFHWRLRDIVQVSVLRSF